MERNLDTSGGNLLLDLVLLLFQLLQLVVCVVDKRLVLAAVVFVRLLVIGYDPSGRRVLCQ